MKALEIGFRFPQDGRRPKRVACSVGGGLLEKGLLGLDQAFKALSTLIKGHAAGVG